MDKEKQDCINKAIELVGWQTTRLGNQRIKVFVPWEGGVVKDIGYIDYPHVIDALAAQLKRLVLATNKAYMIETLGRNRDYTTRVFFYAEKTGPISDGHPSPIVISGGNDSMNFMTFVYPT